MTFKEYQDFAAKGIQPETTKREPIVAFALGLVGESGEVVDDIKKRIFYGRDVPKEHTLEEIGDVLWYLANIATELDISLEDVARQNMQKLRQRYASLYGGNWSTNIDSEEPIIRQGIYQGKAVTFSRSGPHIKMYETVTNKFIKFLNKEEKKQYGITESSSSHGANGSAEEDSAGGEDSRDTALKDNLPWE